MQVFTIGSGRNGTKSMSVILKPAFKYSFHEMQMIPEERKRAYFNKGWLGPKFRAKITRYNSLGDFHDADNCNTYFVHHLCKAFPDAKILIPIGSLFSFIRAHRAWGIMGPNDINIHTRAYPKDDKKWNQRPIVVKLAWLWGTRNIEAIKRSDKSRTLIYATKDIAKQLPTIFKFIGKELCDKAIELSTIRHNKLDYDTDKIAQAEQEIAAHKNEILKTSRPFSGFLSKYVSI